MDSADKTYSVTFSDGTTDEYEVPASWSMERVLDEANDEPWCFTAGQNDWERFRTVVKVVAA